jgi:hypothetical protein
MLNTLAPKDFIDQYFIQNGYILENQNPEAEKLINMLWNKDNDEAIIASSRQLSANYPLADQRTLYAMSIHLGHPTLEVRDAAFSLLEKHYNQINDKTLQVLKNHLLYSFSDTVEFSIEILGKIAVEHQDQRQNIIDAINKAIKAYPEVNKAASIILEELSKQDMQFNAKTAPTTPEILAENNLIRAMEEGDLESVYSSSKSEEYDFLEESSDIEPINMFDISDSQSEESSTSGQSSDIDSDEEQSSDWESNYSNQDVEIRHVRIEHSNPILSKYELLKSAKEGKVLNELIELGGQDNQLAAAIIEATEEYGAEHVINTIFAKHAVNALEQNYLSITASDSSLNSIESAPATEIKIDL